MVALGFHLTAILYLLQLRFLDNLDITQTPQCIQKLQQLFSIQCNALKCVPFQQLQTVQIRSDRTVALCLSDDKNIAIVFNSLEHTQNIHRKIQFNFNPQSARTAQSMIVAIALFAREKGTKSINNKKKTISNRCANRWNNRKYRKNRNNFFVQSKWK